MTYMTIETEQGKNQFVPKDNVSGTVSWDLDRVPDSVGLRLFWYTRGKGDRDVGIVDSMSFPNPGIHDKRDFSFTLPAGPYSFSGRLISLIWALELVAKPMDLTERFPITVSPTGREVRITDQGENS